MSAALDVPAMATPDDVVEGARRIFGSAPPLALGTLHVTAVCEREDGTLVTIAIGDDAPKSAHDTFVLCLARAHADVIVTTGANLRAEPDVRYELFGPGRLPDALARYRRERLGRTMPPRVVVLTRGDVDLAHPALHAWARPEIATTEAGARRLEVEATERRIPVGAHGREALSDLVRRLRSEPGVETISIETGASTSKALYEGAEIAVDQLWLATVQARFSPPTAEPFLRREALRARMARKVVPFVVDEASGRWSFEAWERPS
jgi:hypothetical protein